MFVVPRFSPEGHNTDGLALCIVLYSSRLHASWNRAP